MGALGTIPEGDPFAPGHPIDMLAIPNVQVVVGPATEAADLLIGLPEADTLDGLGGNDIVQGNSGDDDLTGGPGDDALDGGPGADTMRGGDGDDTFVVDDAGDVVTGGRGRDTVLTSVAFDLDGTGTEVVLATGSGGIRIDGSRGGTMQDLTGNEGDDILVGRALRTEMTGGAGADTFVLAGPGSGIYIDDFSGQPFGTGASMRPGEGDRLVVNDQLLGLGDDGIDVRNIRGEVSDISRLTLSGQVQLDRSEGILTVFIDSDFDGRPDAGAQLIDAGNFSLDDVLLF
jgi:Ca2+-binding RTX toxin-like protein